MTHKEEMEASAHQEENKTYISIMDAEYRVQTEYVLEDLKLTNEQYTETTFKVDKEEEIKKFEFRHKYSPRYEHEIKMYHTIQDFDEEAWSNKRKGLCSGFPSIDKAFEGGIFPGFILIAGDSNLGND